MTSPGYEGELSALNEVYRIRQAATDVSRPLGSNVDIFADPTTGDRLALCPISILLPFAQKDSPPSKSSFVNLALVSLAVQHLNAGDGTLVPQVQGLNERCNVRFSVESSNTQRSNSIALQHIVDQDRRDITGEHSKPKPCAFFGPYWSSRSVPMAIVSGILGYPQVSATATSTDLDDKDQFPLFGRTVPSDAGNAIPLVIFMRDKLELKHLAVININNAYGNAFVESLRQAASVYAPDMLIQQFPIDEGSESIEATVASVKSTQYRFIFGLLYGREIHDKLMEEAFKQGIAGDGKHNWLFGDTFAQQDGKEYLKDSPLHLAYRGTAFVKVTGGVPGLEQYDKLVSTLSKLRNPADLDLMQNFWPSIVNETTGKEIIPEFWSEPDFLQSLSSGYRPFTYDAIIALGLAACDAINDEMTLTGQDHFSAFASTTFDGVSGGVSFDNVTGSRDPTGALYQVVNTVESSVEGDKVTFEAITTNYFLNSKWTNEADFTFNDGTARLPVDIAPPKDVQGWKTLPSLILVPSALFLIGALVYVLIKEKRKKAGDSMWRVRKDELTFGDPPEVLGRGTFGLVLLAEYRGTQVAVKRVIPPESTRDARRSGRFDITDSQGDQSGSHTTVASSFAREGNASDLSKVEQDMEAGLVSKDNDEVRSLSESGSALGSWIYQAASASNKGRNSSKKTGRGTTRQEIKKMRVEFIEEMKYLARLRHPCVTTVMGAVVETTDDPMLVMEFMDHGSLYDLLHNDTMALDGEIILPILRDISQGMRFLHSADPRVLHGDLKAANILVDNRFRAKVADFGLSQKKNLGGTGTPYWMAPELLRRESANTCATDVFSFGVILYEVFSRRDPYHGERPKDVLRGIADSAKGKRVVAPSNMPDSVKSLMADCLEEDPDCRPPFSEIDMRLKRMDAYSFPSSERKTQHVSLMDIFPKHIAEALRDGRKPEAEHKELVTIFFSDIVGFTNISAKLDPHKIANMLDRLYRKFDDLSRKHDIYKVETIGDAFMAVSNLVKDQNNDHCKRIAEFSIEAVRAANETLVDEDDPSKGHVNIRVGFHSGSVVADVVGNRNPRYCLFGDTVNTASRMESNSSVNRINCSRQTADILAQQDSSIALTSRGLLSIKGKGKMECFWVNQKGKHSGNELIDRVRMSQKIRFLERDIDSWQDAGSGAKPIPEQPPPKGAESAMTSELDVLAGNLKSRLSRNSNPRD